MWYLHHSFFDGAIVKTSSTQEKVLLYQMIEGDEHAFRLIFLQYKDRLYTYCLKFTKSICMAEEIVQDVFLKIWTNREAIDPEQSFDAYMFTISKHFALNYLEKTAREQKNIARLQDYFIRLQAKNQTEEMMLSAEYEQLLTNAMELMPPRRKLIFRMSRVEGMSHAEIATALHLSRGTIKNHMILALKFLRRYVQLNSDITLLIFLVWEFLMS